MAKRLPALLLSTFISLAPLLVFAPTAHAATDTCTWTGATNTNFNTANNWNCSTDGAAVPDNGDSLVFDNTGFTANADLNNDLSGADFNTITFQGTSSYGFQITGNAITLQNGITVTGGYHGLGVDITLGADQSFVATTNSGGISIGADETNTLNLGSHTLTLTTGTSQSVGIFSTVSGTGGITKTGVGYAGLWSDNTYSGATIISAGTLTTGMANSLGGTGVGTTVASGAALSFGPYSTSGHTVTINEPLTINSATNGVGAAITSGVAATGCGFGYCDDGNVILAGAITLGADVKVDPSGTLTITGALSGAHTISPIGGSYGTLVINSSANTSSSSNSTSSAAAETVTINSGDSQPSTNINVGKNQTYVINGIRGITYVNDGGILKGSGTVGILYVNTGGHLAPGQSPGCLNSGNFSLSGTLDEEIGGTTVCTEYDQMKVTGTVDVTNGTLNTTLYNGFKPAKDQTYTIIDNDGNDAVTGTFTNLAEGATFTVNGYVFKISYKGGDGNDVVLTVQSVPATPDTGFELLTNHPFITLLTTSMLAAGIAFIARCMRQTSTN